jgi:hypothetical protein
MEGDMYFKGKVRKLSFNNPISYALLSWAIIMLLLVFFLSSGRPAWGIPSPYLAMGNAVSITLDMERDDPTFDLYHPPVPYQDWDTSKMLDGWHAMLPYQWALGVYLAHEEMERRAMLKEVVENPPDKTFFYAVSAFFLVIAAGILFADKLFAFAKRKLS